MRDGEETEGMSKYKRLAAWDYRRWWGHIVGAETAIYGDADFQFWAPQRRTL